MLLVFLLTAAPFVFSQQSYPVHVTVQVLPPHGLHLSDYYSGTRYRLLVTLLNRDFGQPVLNVRLRVTVRNGNHFMLRSRDELPAPVITLTHGVPVRLTGADLAPYLMPNRVTLQVRLNNGKLPTGHTEFIVQVLDHATGQVLSQAAVGSAWLVLNQPPMLNLPTQGEQVAFRTPQHIRFQWFPRHQALAHTVYEFILRELPDNDVPPQMAFMFGNTIYQTTTRFTTLNLTHLQPILEPGRRYAWQVRAMTVDGIDEIGTFANHGFTEIGWFQVNENCPPPMNVRAEAAFRRMTLRWQSHHQHQSFVVEYRVKSEREEDWQWHTKEVQGNETTIQRLNPGWTYWYRVGALCPATREPVFSDIGEVTIPLYDAERMARCGQAPTDTITNRTPIETLRPGDVVTVSLEFPMTVLEATPLGDGWFSGRGFTTVGWLFDIDIAVRFDRLRVNTDLQQIDGVVLSEYDPSWGQIMDVTQIIHGGRPTTPGSVVFETFRVHFPLPDAPVMRYNPDTGMLTIYDANGTPHTFTIPRNAEQESAFPIIVEDINGNRFKVELPEEGQTNADGTKTPIVTRIRDLEAGSFETRRLDESSGVIVRFNRGNGRFGFDDGKLFREANTRRIRDFHPLWGTNYIPPWKLIPTGESDVVEARIETGNANTDNIYFVLECGTGVPARKDNNRWILTLPATGHSQHYAVFAVYRRDGRNMPVGRLGVVSYDTMHRTIVLIEVDAQVPLSREQIERELNQIYNQYGVTISVEIDRSIQDNMEWDLDGDRKMNLSGSAFFTTETSEMRELRRIFQRTDGYNPASYHIFIMHQANIDQDAYAEFSVMGDMPRGQHFGFAFMDAVRADQLVWLIAHELGHGAFTLRHTFNESILGSATKRQTNNLMDYSCLERGTELGAYQWNMMRFPAEITRFDDDEEGQARLRDYIRFLIEEPRRSQKFLTRQIVEALRFWYYFNEYVTINCANSNMTNFAINNILLGDFRTYGRIDVRLHQRGPIRINPPRTAGLSYNIQGFPTRFGFGRYGGIRRNTYSVELQTGTDIEFRDLKDYIRSVNRSWSGSTDILLNSVRNNGCEYSLQNLLALPAEALSRLSSDQRILLLQRTANSNIGCSGTQAAVLRIIESFSDSPSDQARLLRELTPQMKMRFVNMYRWSSSMQSRIVTILSAYHLNQLPPERAKPLSGHWFIWDNTRFLEPSHFGSFVEIRFRVRGGDLRTSIISLMSPVGVWFNVDTYEEELIIMTAFELYWLIREGLTERRLQDLKTAIEIASFLIPGTKAIRGVQLAVRAGRFGRAIYLGVGATFYTYDLLALSVELSRYVNAESVNASPVFEFIENVRLVYNLSNVVISRAITREKVPLYADFIAAWTVYKRRDLFEEIRRNSNNSQTAEEMIDTLQRIVEEVESEISKHQAL